MSLLVHTCPILTCMDAPKGKTRKPRPGEKCPCGRPAVIVHVKKMGDVASCEAPHLETQPPPKGSV